MIKRKIQQELAKLAQEYKVVTITGPRQSGKTTLARMQFPDYTGNPAVGGTRCQRISEALFRSDHH